MNNIHTDTLREVLGKVLYMYDIGGALFRLLLVCKRWTAITLDIWPAVARKVINHQPLTSLVLDSIITGNTSNITNSGIWHVRLPSLIYVDLAIQFVRKPVEDGSSLQMRQVWAKVGRVSNHIILGWLPNTDGTYGYNGIDYRVEYNRSSGCLPADTYEGQTKWALDIIHHVYPELASVLTTD